MKKKTYLGICLVLLALLLVGCRLFEGEKDPTVIEKEPDIVEIQSSITETYEKVSKACVGIYATNRLENIASSGSGVIYKEDNGTYFVVTNSHVVEDMTAYQIYLGKSRYYSAKLVGRDPSNDIAVLTFSLDLFGGDVAVCDIFSYDEEIVSVGQTVLAIGCPLGLENYNYLSTGVVSKVTSAMVQTNAEINPGNSGGGLFNLSGRLIGINTEKQVYTTSYDENGNMEQIPVEGMGYAVILDVVKKCITDIENKTGVIERPKLGITIAALNRYLQPQAPEWTYFPNEVEEGLIVRAIDSDGAAASSSLQVNDVLLTTDGKTITTSNDLSNILALKLSGDTITFEVYRAHANEKKVTVTITL